MSAPPNCAATVPICVLFRDTRRTRARTARPRAHSICTFSDARLLAYSVLSGTARHELVNSQRCEETDKGRAHRGAARPLPICHPHEAHRLQRLGASPASLRASRLANLSLVSSLPPLRLSAFRYAA